MSDNALMSTKDRPNENASTRRSRSAQAEVRPSASVNMDELRELIALLRDNGLAELELERADFRVKLRRDWTTAAADTSVEAGNPLALVPSAVQQSPQANVAPPHPGAVAETAALADQDLHIIPSPIVGTFYRSPSPSAEPFVKIGSVVESDSIVCIIEAMKLMNEIQADTSGEVVKIYVENGQPVEYGQPLFGIRQ